jgi:hypothetical protein
MAELNVENTNLKEKMEKKKVFYEEIKQEREKYYEKKKDLFKIKMEINELKKKLNKN